MRLRALFGCAAALTACAVILTADLAATGTARTGGSASAVVAHAAVAHTLAANRQAARRQASRMLAVLELPAGASSSATEPSGGGSWLKPAPGLNATPARFDVHAWWSVPGSPGSVLAYVQSHRPAGSRVLATSTGQGSGESAETVTYDWRAIPGVLGNRELAVTVVGLPGGSTGVLAQAEAVWVIPRPRRERIPARARELDVTSAKLSGATVFTHHITDHSTVRRFAKLLNAMPTVQPYVYNCPALIITGARVLTFDFRTRGGGPLLARARYVAWPGLARVSGPCDPIQIAIGGRGRTPLIGGRFLAQARRILGPRALSAG